MGPLQEGAAQVLEVSRNRGAVVNRYPVAVSLFHHDKEVRVITEACEAEALVNRWLQHHGGAEQQRAEFSAWGKAYVEKVKAS